MDKKDKLINAVIKNKDKISYINLDKNNSYRGWVSDFNIILPNGKKMSLDLKQDSDLFLLFVLASSWSKTGAWENAAFFTTYLKDSKKDNPSLWLDPEFVETESINRREEVQNITKSCKGFISRKKVSFRIDYYPSIVVIAENWNQIKSKLNESDKTNDYNIFINYIRSLDGLGRGKNKMNIKIPLILRELRCQNIYKNIPGELCCVPDKRVKTSCAKIGICLPKGNSFKDTLKASKIIFENFGDLYDIPLFAYEDVKKDMSHD